MQNNNNIMLLLENVYQKLDEYYKNNRKEAVLFNVFEVTGIANKEVIMCRLLYNFLNIAESHGQGDVFLHSFLKHVLETGTEIDYFDEEEIKTIHVRREEVIDEKRRIDLVLESRNRYIPIEVKIGATEQENQCNDYYKFAIKKNGQKENGKSWKVFYLTLYGDDATTMDNQSMIQNISWEKHIINWLEDICGQASIKRISKLYEIVYQFKDAVLKLTGQKTEGENAVVKEIVMSSKENMEAASAIYNSFIQIKQEKMKKVLNDLEEKFNGVMDEEIKREQLQNFEKQIKVGHLQNFNEQINGYYKHSYQPEFAYKLIEFEIGDNGATEKYALFLRCEIDARLFLGFCVRQWSEGKKCYCDVFDDKNYPMPEKIKNRVNEYIEFSDSQYQGENGWLEWYYLPTRKRDDTEEEIPNFKHLSNGYFKLFDEEGKNEIIDKSVEGFEEMCHKIKWECIRRDLDK